MPIIIFYLTGLLLYSFAAFVFK